MIAVSALLLFSLAFLNYPSFAQTKTVTGTVIDSKTTEPVTGASISVKGTTIGTTTDKTGKFRLDVPNNAVLVISNIGFDQQELAPDASGIVSVKLININRELSDVVVVGYGTSKKATLTGAVTTVNSKIFQDRGVISNPLAALQGQVPGVVVSRSSAAPGQEGWAFQIRGASSVNAVDPLVVLDGVPLPNLNALNSINPQDIDNLSFLKDASAAIYGSRAAAGVVLITTKRAKSGKPTIQYNGSVSQKRMGLKPGFLNGDQYGQYLYKAISNASTGGVPDENWIWTKYAQAWMNKPASLYIDKTTPGYTDNIGFTDVKDYTFLIPTLSLFYGAKEGRSLTSMILVLLQEQTRWVIGYHWVI
jgi:TonB-dependent SusC/RagA subfamily outer membrane receptor